MSKEILKLIESVDPNDTAKMDEIDARISFFIDCERKWKFDRIQNGLVYYASEFGGTYLLGNGIYSGPKYTRSRDALKAIRPEGWEYTMFQLNVHWRCKLRPPNGSSIRDVTSILQRTEELAELDAVIQAIEYERTQGGI